MDNTWVKIYRRSIENGWLTNHKLWVFWCYCLLKASRTDYMQVVGNQQVPLKPGQFVFGRKAAAKETGMSEQSVRTCIDSLRRMKNLTTKSTNKFSVVTIVNWSSYQSDKSKSTNKSTCEQPAGNQPATTNKSKEIRDKAIMVIDYLNQVTGKNFKHVDSNINFITPRLNEGYLVDQIKRMIDIKVKQWKGDPTMDKFLRPSTLFIPKNFDGYMNENDITPSDKRSDMYKAQGVSHE